jgi:hypothetical protein
MVPKRNLRISNNKAKFIFFCATFFERRIYCFFLIYGFLSATSFCYEGTFDLSNPPQRKFINNLQRNNRVVVPPPKEILHVTAFDLLEEWIY